MNYVTCGARTHRGTVCNAIAVGAGKRCHYHGGKSTGPRTLIGKLRNGDTLRRYRINGPPAGYHHTGKAAAKRLARARRQAAQPARDERKRLRQLRWEQKKRLRAGLPLLTEAEIENFACDAVSSD